MKQTIKNILMSVWYFLFNKRYRTLRSSICFDSGFYKRTYSDVMSDGIDPLLHYFTLGYKELRQTSLLFDIPYYLKQDPSLKETDQDLLFHFLGGGWQIGMKPNMLFDPLWYVADNPEVDFSRINPLTHFLKKGGHGASSLYFDSAFYAAEYQDAGTSTEIPLAHYLMIGVPERRRPSLYFDMKWYIDKTPILRESEIDPLTYYFDYGIAERKSPSPLFDPKYYMERYNVQEQGDLFAHYVKHGAPAGHWPCSWFDPEFYREQYLIPVNDSTPPLDHYLEKGVQNTLYPNRRVYELLHKPVISLLVPVYNVTPAHLNNCIRSVLYQSYPHWELCLVDDGSTRKEVRPLLEYWASWDSRIKVNFLDENMGISGATNAAASLATGRYLGFLDNDDELANDCLFRVVEKINSEEADLYYSDEDLIGEDGRQFSVFNKPDFNEELLLSHNYVTHFVVVDKILYEKVGGFDQDLDGAQDFDLFLKLSEKAKKIIHIPEILYHWRASESSTSIHHDQKQYANEAGRKAVVNALKRRGLNAKVEMTDWKFYYRIKREQGAFPQISVLILYTADSDFGTWFPNLLSCTGYSKTDFFIVCDTEEKLLSLKQRTQDHGRQIHLLSTIPGSSPAACFNEAVRQSRGQFIVFLNSQVQLQKNDWIESMLEYALAPDSGIVGGRILPFHGDEFVTTIPDLSEQSDFYFARFLQRCSQHMNGLQCVQNVLALSWDLVMVERENFLAFDGFNDELFGYLFADSDLCLRMRAKGYEHIYTPFALGQWLIPEEKQLGHLESLSYQERTSFQKKWHELLHSGDPYYNYGVLEQNGIDFDEFLQWYAGEEPH